MLIQNKIQLHQAITQPNGIKTALEFFDEWVPLQWIQDHLGLPPINIRHFKELSKKEGIYLEQREGIWFASSKNKKFNIIWDKLFIIFLRLSILNNMGESYHHNYFPNLLHSEKYIHTDLKNNPPAMPDIIYVIITSNVFHILLKELQTARKQLLFAYYPYRNQLKKNLINTVFPDGNHPFIKREMPRVKFLIPKKAISYFDDPQQSELMNISWFIGNHLCKAQIRYSAPEIFDTSNPNIIFYDPNDMKDACIKICPPNTKPQTPIAINITG